MNGLRIARGGNVFFDRRGGLRANAPRYFEQSFCLFCGAIDLHDTFEIAGFLMADDHPVLQDRIGTGQLPAFPNQAVVMIKRYLDQHIHHAKVKQRMSSVNVPNNNLYELSRSGRDPAGMDCLRQ
jgi:hypothetical protein